MAAYWLIKSEPGVYPFSQLRQDKRTSWTGVRNFEARNNLRAMKKGDLALYYHSGEGKEIVGVAKIVGTAVADPTSPGEDWSTVEVAYGYPLARPIALAELKKTAGFKGFGLITRSRLSVVPVSPKHFDLVTKLTGTKA